MNIKPAVLIAIACLGLVSSSAWAQQQRTNCPMMSASGSPGGMGMMRGMYVTSEFDYLSKMIPHHQEAIATANLILERSDRPEMREFAQNIIRVQQAEIDQMKTWLAEWYPGRDITVSYTPMMRDLSQLQGDALDQAFLQDMVMHHMGAVMMSHMLLNHSLVEHSAVQPFAEAIARTQQQEIAQMQTWLGDWFGTTAMGGMGRMHGGNRMMGGNGMMGGGYGPMHFRRPVAP